MEFMSMAKKIAENNPEITGYFVGCKVNFHDPKSDLLNPYNIYCSKWISEGGAVVNDEHMQYTPRTKL